MRTIWVGLCWILFLSVFSCGSSAEVVVSSAVANSIALPWARGLPAQSLNASHYLRSSHLLTTYQNASYYQRDYRNQWLNSPIHERILLSERIGEQGRARYATEQRWIKLLGSQNRGIVQGPDSVYWDPRNGVMRALESKGGGSRLKTTYGQLQGTNANTIKSLEFAIKSPKTSFNDKVRYAMAIENGINNKLRTDVISTTHVLGKPNAPSYIGGDASKTDQLARDIKHQLLKSNPVSI